MARRSPTPAPTPRPPAATPQDLRERILADFGVLRVPLTAAQLDAALAQAAQDGLSHLAFLHRVLTDQAGLRRERSSARRIREARFKELKTLATFDWDFNSKAINRLQIEELATGDFIRRRQNLVLAGHSGVGKSFLVQAIGQAACMHGYRVRYLTSAALLQHLTASLADQTLAKRVRAYARCDLLIIDEFGFDRLERSEAPRRPVCSTRSWTPAARRSARPWSPTSTLRPGASTSAIRRWPWPSSIAWSMVPLF